MSAAFRFHGAATEDGVNIVFTRVKYHEKTVLASFGTGDGNFDFWLWCGPQIWGNSLLRSIGAGAYDVSMKRHSAVKYPPTTDVKVFTDKSQLPELYIELAEIVVRETTTKQDPIALGGGGAEPLESTIRNKLIDRDIIPRAQKIGANAIVIVHAQNHISFSYRQSSNPFAPKGVTDSYRSDTRIVQALAIKYKSVDVK